MDASGAGNGSRPKPQPQPGTRESLTDRISPLPDDLLLQLLSRLGDTRAAARTTVLSRRFLGLFSRLPGIDVTLHDVPLGSLEDALRRAARPELRLIDIAVPVQEPLPACGQDGGAPAATVSAVLLEAARLSPVQVRFALLPKLKLSPAGAVDLPGFGRATSIDLRAGPDIPLTHSRASTGFPLLESLSLSGWRVDLAALIPRCPRLRVLTVAAPARSPAGVTDFFVHSLSLQGLVVDRGSMPTCRIVVQAPVLKRFTMSFKASRKKLSVSIVAPILEDVSWRCSYTSSAVHRLGLWHLLEVSLETADGHRRWSTGSSNAADTTGEDDARSPLPRVNVLSLRMCCAKGSFGLQDGDTEFVAEISKHMVTDFSRLELHITSRGHGFGSFVWRLLGTHHIRNATQSLRIVLLRSEVKVACQPNCPCDGPWNWRNQPVCSPNLENLEIEGFEGEDHEFDFLKLVFRHAWKLRRVTVRLPDQVTPNGDWCTKLHNIFMAYPSVEANVDLIPDMEGIIQSVQDHQHLARSDSEFYGPEVDISPDDAANYTNLLAPDIPPVYTRSKMTNEDAEALCLRLARYRVAYYKKVASQQSAREFKDPEDYSVEELQENWYFYALEKDESFEGCFHPDDTFVAELDDYQRLLVFNGLPDNSDSLYIYWEDYHAYHRTYEVDDAYVKFYGELSRKIKWLKDYLDLDCESEKWIEVGTRAWRQALRIASDLPSLSAIVAGMAFDEYISELRKDKSLENWFLFYFDVWKINSLKKGSLRAAVEEAYEKHKSSLQFEGMDAERKARVISKCVNTFRALLFVGDNTENLEENEALDFFRTKVFKKFKPKNMAKYAQKKLEIAAMMKLVPRQA